MQAKRSVVAAQRWECIESTRAESGVGPESASAPSFVATEQTLQQAHEGDSRAPQRSGVSAARRRPSGPGTRVEGGLIPSC